MRRKGSRTWATSSMSETLLKVKDNNFIKPIKSSLF